MKLQDRDWAGNPLVEIQEADLSDVDGLARNLEGCEAAVYLVHSMTSAGADYAKQDFTLASKFAQAARKAGGEEAKAKPAEAAR